MEPETLKTRELSFQQASKHVHDEALIQAGNVDAYRK